MRKKGFLGFLGCDSAERMRELLNFSLPISFLICETILIIPGTVACEIILSPQGKKMSYQSMIYD